MISLFVTLRIWTWGAPPSTAELSGLSNKFEKC